MALVMNTPINIDYSALKMSTATFERIGQFIQNEVGIKLPPVKRTMVEARLQKRLRALGLRSFEAYCEYAFGPEGREELISMIDVITTNKTDFFREPAHFSHLMDKAIPQLRAEGVLESGTELRVWSAGCSTGEEPYTLAMLLADAESRSASGPFRILATDISTQVLEKARMAIYAAEKADPVPEALKRQFLLRSKDRTRPQVRIAPELRHKVHFQRVNFMDEEYGVRETFHIIFCRNVIIYFNRDIQQRIIGKLIQHLHPGGFLYLGHSETLHGLDLPLVSVAPTVYRKRPGQGGAS